MLISGGRSAFAPGGAPGQIAMVGWSGEGGHTESGTEDCAHAPPQNATTTAINKDFLHMF
jgi:hypothetical protein